MNTPFFKYTAKILTLTLLMIMGTASTGAEAADLPQAAGSPSAGITFDDRPLLLPVQRNFQMAMLTASSELGRSCGHMEAYGWRMAANEQDRVNQIFNNSVDRLRAQGFVVETKAPTSVSKDVTLFTADRPDKHMIFMWSAGEIGLVMVMCETSAPLTTRLTPAPAVDAGTQSFPEMGAAIRNKTEISTTPKPKNEFKNFSPAGDWVGNYTCEQGTTGATLHIGRLHADSFEGTFRFYPTPKNPYMPTGMYKVSGEYDRETQRILINPGQWLQRPKDYYNTVIIGSFDPVAKTFSGFFQGINGCTSFEAHYSVDSADIKGSDREIKKSKKAKAKKAKPVKAKKTKTTKTKPAEKVVAPEPAPQSPASAPEPTPPVPEPVSPSPAPEPTPPSAPEPTPAPAPEAAASPAPTVPLPEPTPPPVPTPDAAPPLPAPVPQAVAPAPAAAPPSQLSPAEIAAQRRAARQLQQEKQKAASAPVTPASATEATPPVSASAPQLPPPPPMAPPSEPVPPATLPTPDVSPLAPTATPATPPADQAPAAAPPAQ